MPNETDEEEETDTKAESPTDRPRQGDRREQKVVGRGWMDPAKLSSCEFNKAIIWVPLRTRLVDTQTLIPVSEIRLRTVRTHALTVQYDTAAPSGASMTEKGTTLLLDPLLFRCPLSLSLSLSLSSLTYKRPLLPRHQTLQYSELRKLRGEWGRLGRRRGANSRAGHSERIQLSSATFREASSKVTCSVNLFPVRSHS